MSKEEVFQKVREKDEAVLHCIEGGDSDIQLITSSTTLSNSEVNYCFRKLEEIGLIQVQKQEGMVERVVDGTTQVFEAPKRASMTPLGEEYLENYSNDSVEKYSEKGREELAERVAELESDIEELQSKFEVFRRQVNQKLSEL
jgi:predicted transcriptional regulator